jgi:HK97 family phage major capsid protein
MALVGTATNRTSIDLPVDVSQEIMAKTQEDSAIMRLARQIALPGRGTSIPVITSDPEASWVGETYSKPVSNPGLATKVMRAYKLAVIVPFSNEFRRDVASLYDALIERLPRALAMKFDATVFGNGDKPGDDFDNFAAVTTQSLASDAYAGLVAADTDVALHGGVVNGYAISPQMRGILLGAEDTSHRPIFINTVSDGAVDRLLGAPVVLSKGAFVSGSPAVVGVAGDWSQAMYGTVEGVRIDYSSDATLTVNDSTINLFQQNMFAVRAEIEVGFRANTDMFNALTATSVPSI